MIHQTSTNPQGLDKAAFSSPPQNTKQNWAANIDYHAQAICMPRTLEELQETVQAASKCRVLGTGHAFNDLADTTGTHISLRNFATVLHLDRTKQQVVVGGGIRYGDLAEFLHRAGFALENLASLPHISVAGACSTATHGSGITNKNLSAAVEAITFIKADGEPISLSREKDPEIFPGVVVSLGSLGAIAELTLKIKKTFDVRQEVYENVNFNEASLCFEDVMSSGYSVSLFYDWRSPLINQLWFKESINESDLDSGALGRKKLHDFLGSSKAAQTNLHPIRELPATYCTEQLGKAGPWHERLPHFRMELPPSSGNELQSEYFVPLPYAGEALAALRELSVQIADAVQISEFRTIAKDDLWLSPCNHPTQPSAAFHFTWKKDWAKVRALLPKIELALAPAHALPHWAKLFTLSPSDISDRYPRLRDFNDLRRRFDPPGKFENEFVQRYLGSIKH